MLYLIGLGICGGIYLGYGLLNKARYIPRSTGTTGNLPQLSIIIPARNEERNLPKLLSSLQRQDLSFIKHEIIVVDDQSDDQTASVSANFGATVIKNPSLPEGWTGKTWALHNGVLKASGEWFLFLDSDLSIEPGALPDVLNLFASLGRGNALSILPFHKTVRFYESFSFFFNVLMAMGTGAFGGSREALAKTKLVGQFLLLSKLDYLKVGGYGCVSGEVLENFFLSKKLLDAGVSCQTFLGKNSVSFRMFPEGISQLVEGWTKAFVRGSASVETTILLRTIVWIFSLMTIIVIAPFFPAMSLAIYLFATLHLFWIRNKIGNFSVFHLLGWPVLLLFYQYLFFNALVLKKRKKAIKWKGRSV